MVSEPSTYGQLVPWSTGKPSRQGAKVKIGVMGLVSKWQKEQANDQKIQEPEDTKTTYIVASTGDAGDPTPTEVQPGGPTPTDSQTSRG